MIWLRTFFVFFLFAATARSEESAAPLSWQFKITVTDLKETPSYITQVIVPEANCAAINDAASLLIVGHQTKDDHHLAVFHLDAQGMPSGEPTWITLPKPEALAANFNYPLGLLFHPTLPLLYVWQDINGPPANKQENNPEFVNHLEFDHLLIYAIKDGALELLQTGARGTGFHCGLTDGTVGLDYNAKNLYVPNALGGTPDEGGIGVYALDDKGLPGENFEGAAADSKSKGMKIELTSKSQKKVTKLVPLPKSNRSYRYYPTGAGWVAGRNAMIMGGYSGCMVADINNGSLRQSWFDLPDVSGACVLAGHPKLPAVYFTLKDNNRVYEIAQVDGYVTLLPQVGTVLGAHYQGTPAVLTSLSRLAVGDSKSLHLFGLQQDGKLDGKDERVKLPSAIVKGFAWSEKFGRLYVAVDKEK